MVASSIRGDFRKVWYDVRALVQHGLGPRQRVYHHTAAFTPTNEEWINLMKCLGPQGGTSADILWQSSWEELGQFFRLGQLPVVPISRSAVCADSQIVPNDDHDLEAAAAENFVGVQEALHHVHGFSVPPWGLPQCIWRAVFDHPGAFTRLILQFFVIIRQSGLLPLQWLVSLGIPIWKQNAKQGPAAFRVIHLLDALSKAWFRSLWSRRIPTPAPMVFGAFAKHRREEVAIINHALQFRWAKAGLCFAAALFDQANAFNSIRWSVLERPLHRTPPRADLHFLQVRNRRILCLMGSPETDAFIFAANSGTRQGDTPAAQEFASAYQLIVRNFDRSRYSPLETLDTLCGDSMCSWVAQLGLMTTSNG
eukprot:TRINITY_DN11535_c0_g1_i1.p1 TRINITY_DN11535_c0_g1~~TRINITY_DN11535_c0_g1_i1.p1  ORF type:complete len:366 (+),score=39.46 TRINITY_DN11535_c0_g1_i1:1391-2488(+)